MASLSLKTVNKTFGAVTVIPGIDLDIASGEFVALVGPSGCGKSTLLRMIAGLEEVNGGEIWIDDVCVNEVSPKDRNIAMVFQSYALYPQMTVAQNMAFNLKLAGRPKDEISARVREAARMLDLEALLDRKPGQLSGGQRQRVAMGRAIVRNPKVFLFDEPLSNLDAKLRVAMRAEIKRLHQATRTTSVYVTHDQIEAMTLADRLVVLNKGVIEQQGTPMELYRNPANLFVAGFIGSPAMNFIDAQVQIEQGVAKAIFADGKSLVLSQEGLSAGQKIVVGLRPEFITAGSANALEGPVVMVEPTGAQTLVYVQFGGKTITVIVDGGTELAVGDAFSAGIEPAQILLFDPVSGARI
jgi:multiple sugar transport system ATP-binding protein